MTNSVIKIIINKHQETNACLAQSVEHSAVNRSVGGPSPSTGAKKNTQVFFFFMLRCTTSKRQKGTHRCSFFCACFDLVPQPHDCAAAHSATTLLPNWTRCVEVNKFTRNAIFRESESRFAFEKCDTVYHTVAPKRTHKCSFFYIEVYHTETPKRSTIVFFFLCLFQSWTPAARLFVLFFFNNYLTFVCFYIKNS